MARRAPQTPSWRCPDFDRKRETVSDGDSLSDGSDDDWSEPEHGRDEGSDSATNE